MPTVSTDVAVEQLLAVLAEAFEGPRQSWSYFTDQGAESGLFGTIVALNAATVSRVWGGTTIAAHVHHAAFGLAASAAWIAGDHSSRDWQKSWSVITVTDFEWRGLQQRLRESYDELRKAIASHASASTESIGGAVGAVAHAAYHLGAIRQKAALSRKGL
jgi:hypothetical protein